MSNNKKTIIVICAVIALIVLGVLNKKEDNQIGNDVKNDTEKSEPRDFNYSIIEKAPYGLASNLGFKYIVKIDHTTVSKNDLFKLAKFLFNVTDDAYKYKEFILFVNDDVEGYEAVGLFKLTAKKCCFLEDKDISFEEVNFNYENRLIKD